MKKTIILSLGVLGLLMFTGCGSTTTNNVNTENDTTENTELGFIKGAVDCSRLNDYGGVILVNAATPYKKGISVSSFIISITTNTQGSKLSYPIVDVSNDGDLLKISDEIYIDKNEEDTDFVGVSMHYLSNGVDSVVKGGCFQDKYVDVE